MIKIEVTGASIAEVADKLLALGSSLQERPATFMHAYKHQTVTLPTITDPVMPEVAEAAFPPFAPEVAVTPGEPHTSETSAPTPDASSSSASEPTEPRSLISADALRDLVLSVVRAKGREAMVAVLDTFGAAKASDVPAAHVPELVAALKALL